jgi:hypothetical protein
MLQFIVLDANSWYKYRVLKFKVGCIYCSMHRFFNTFFSAFRLLDVYEKGGGALNDSFLIIQPSTLRHVKRHGRWKVWFRSVTYNVIAPSVYKTSLFYLFWEWTVKGILEHKIIANAALLFFGTIVLRSKVVTSSQIAKRSLSKSSMQGIQQNISNDIMKLNTY